MHRRPQGSTRTDTLLSYTTRFRSLNRLRQAQAPVIQEPPQWTNRMHIEDAARACAHLLMLDEAQPCYIGSDDRPMPMAQLYDALADMLGAPRSEEHTSELQSLMRISYAVFCLKKTNTITTHS